VLKSGQQAPGAPPTQRTQPPAAAPAVAKEAHAAHPAGGADDGIHVECASCKALLAVKDVGTYKCPRCFTLFNYVGGGKASFLPRRKTVPMQLSLNFSDEATSGLLEFVKVVAKRAGFNDGGMTQLLDAVKDTVGTIRRYSYGNNDNNIYHVMMVHADSEIELRFADYGASLPATKTDDSGKPVFHAAREAMDKFELKNHPKGGNVLTLSKKAK